MNRLVILAIKAHLPVCTLCLSNIIPCCQPPTLCAGPTLLARPGSILNSLFAHKGLSTRSASSLPAISPVTTGWNPSVKAFLKLPLQQDSLSLVPSPPCCPSSPQKRERNFKLKTSSFP